MPRPYTLKRRAESQAATRKRIVEAAIALHASVGPARTTLSMIAERAGVQRHTLYAHFPDERSLALACSGLHLEREPLPAAGDWRRIEDVSDRLRIGLSALYAWYERNAELARCVLRDAECHPLTKEIVELRFGPALSAIAEVLGEGLTQEQRPLLRLAMSYHTWRSLALESGVGTPAAVDIMVHAIGTAG